MASSRSIKTAQDARRDFISQLPADLKDRILEWLPTRDAAKTALLSTHWKDVWLRHGRLVFDKHLFQSVRTCKGDKSLSVVNTIDNILLQRAGPVTKFTLHCCYLQLKLNFKLQQSDLERWCLFLSRNGLQELNISSLIDDGSNYKLPVCIVLCPTMKKLKLSGFPICFPVNAGCIFPSVTSLVFKWVDFSNVNGAVFSIPNLETLDFDSCKETNNFEIIAPKLKSRSYIDFPSAFESRWWFTHHLKAIKTLCLHAKLLSHENVVLAASMFPTAINLRVIKLYYLCFADGEQLTVALQLFQKSPNLCELEIRLYDRWRLSDDIKVASRLLEDPNCCIINQDMKMLNTLKIEQFSGSTFQMHFVMGLLSKSPRLEKFFIQVNENIDPAKIQRELLCFPRASPKAQIVCIDSLVGYGHQVLGIQYATAPCMVQSGLNLN